MLALLITDLLRAYSISKFSEIQVFKSKKPKSVKEIKKKNSQISPPPKKKVSFGETMNKQFEIL